jgi:hypothetical protein
LLVIELDAIVAVLSATENVLGWALNHEYFSGSLEARRDLWIPGCPARVGLRLQATWRTLK